MILKEFSDTDYYGNYGGFESIRYIGRDALGCSNREDVNKAIEDSLFKDCITEDGYKGVVIGFEDNSIFYEYYYIVYVPSTGKIQYETKIRLSSNSKKKSEIVRDE